jgi:hypothetical protein
MPGGADLGVMADELVARLDRACARMEAWLREVPEWRRHPTSPDGGVSSHFGPTILSEQDCVMHYARHLADEGVPWEDMHFELAASTWLFPPQRPGGTRWRADLAIVRRERLLGSELPDVDGAFSFDAVVEFKLASNYWLFGTKWGAPEIFHRDAERDVAKVAGYVRERICRLGYLIIVEEADASFPPRMAHIFEAAHPGVRVRVLRRWGDQQEASP